MVALHTIPQHWCSHRFVTSEPVDLIVIHTNEGPEGPTSAENLAAYLARDSVVPGYHYIVDENSIVQGCPLSQRCNGAGGVNSRAVHICITGFAAQNLEQWKDAPSRKALALAQDLAITLADHYGLPYNRIVDPRGDNKGVCGHVDVSRYYTASAGHYDPGPHFPWAEFMSGSVDDMSAEDVAAIKSHIDAKLMVLASEVFKHVDKAVEEAIKPVRQAVRDGEGKSIPAKTYRLLDPDGDGDVDLPDEGNSPPA